MRTKEGVEHMINRGEHMKYKTFCAANSGDGFISLFDTLLDEKKHRIYYIKGGPGSGKSTLLKQIAERSDSAELIHCSGDPTSLDGVVLPEQNAVILDATAPHSYEPQYPGVGGNIIDLGEGWEPEKLDKKTIIKLSDQKKELYKNCYALLKSAKNIHKGVFTPLKKQLSIHKVHSAADKILRQNALWENFNRNPIIHERFLSGISPDGRVTYCNTFCSLGKNIIILEDRWMVGHTFLSYLDRRLTENGIDHINCFHPLLGKETLQHMIIPSAELSIVSRDGLFPLELPEENILRKISLQGMMDKEYLEENKNKLAFIKRLEREILNLAIVKLNEARALHMKIEQEYAKGTDFAATAGLKEKLMNKLFPST